MKSILISFVVWVFIANINYGQDWIQAGPINPPVVMTQPLPTVVYSTAPIIPQQRPMVYQWVPHVVNQPTLVQYHTFFCRPVYWVVNKPTVQWVYQLTYINP